MEVIINALLRYWPIYSVISGSIVGLVVWNLNVDRRLSKMENICSMSKETTNKREVAVDKAMDNLFTLLNELVPIVHEIKGMMKGGKDNG